MQDYAQSQPRPTQQLTQLLLAAATSNDHHRDEAWIILKKSQQQNLPSLLNCLFQIIVSPQQHVRIIACAYLRNILLEENRLPDLNQHFLDAFKTLYGHFKEAETLLECLGLYLSKRQVRSHRQNFFDRTIQNLIRNNDDLAVMYMLRAVLNAIPINCGFNEGQAFMFKFFINDMIRNDSWVWADTKIAMARYCRYSLKWEILEKMLRDHSNRKTVILSIVRYVTDFTSTMDNLQQCVYLFCFVKHMVDNIGCANFEEEQLEMVFAVWHKLLYKMNQFKQKNATEITNFTQNFALFTQIMDILVKVTEAFDGMSLVLNKDAIQVIQAYSNLIDEERIVQYTNRIKDSKNFGAFLVLLSGMPGRIMGIFGGDQIIQEILGKKLPIDNIPVLHFLEKVINSFPMMEQKELINIGMYLKDVLEQSQDLKALCLTFLVLSQALTKYPVLQSDDAVVNHFQRGLTLLALPDLQDSGMALVVEGLQMTIGARCSYQKLHQNMISCLKGLIERSVYKGPVFLFPRFHKSAMQKILFIFRMLNETYISHNMRCSMHPLLIHSAMMEKNEALNEEAIALTGKILLQANNSQLSERQIIWFIQEFLNFKVLQFIRGCIKETDHTPQFVSNCLNLVLELAFHQTYYPFVCGFCQDALCNVDCIIQLLSIINAPLAEPLLKKLQSEEAANRVQARRNIQKLISTMTLDQTQQTQQGFPYSHIPPNSKVYSIMTKDKFILQRKKLLEFSNSF